MVLRQDQNMSAIRIRYPNMENLKHLEFELSKHYSDVVCINEPKRTDIEGCDTISIGQNVSPVDASRVISIARKYMPYLCHVVINTTRSNTLFLGGYSKGLPNIQEWKNSDFEKINPSWEIDELHYFIGTVNSAKTPNHPH